MRVLVLDLAVNTTGYSIWMNGKHKFSGIIKSDTKENKESWIPIGEWRSEKELYTKRRGKTVKKSDNIRRTDITNNKIEYLDEEIENLILKYNIDYIIVELPIFAKDTKTAIDIGKVQSVSIQGLKVIGYYPLEWSLKIRKLVKSNFTFTNKKNESYKPKSTDKNKLDSIKFYIHETDNIPKTSDEADAFCIGYYHHEIDNGNFSYKKLKEVL